MHCTPSLTSWLPVVFSWWRHTGDTRTATWPGTAIPNCSTFNSSSFDSKLLFLYLRENKQTNKQTNKQKMWQMKVKVSHWPVCCVVEFSPWLYHLTSVPLWVDFAPKMLCVRANHSRHNAGIYELCANCPFLHLSPSIQILPPLFIERRHSVPAALPHREPEIFVYRKIPFVSVAYITS